MNLLSGVGRSVNTTQVVANWLIGQEIVEEEQRGKARAEYGKRLLARLAARLRKDFGSGYSVDNLEMFRRFYLDYPLLISDAAQRKLPGTAKSDAARRNSLGSTTSAVVILHAASGESS